MPDDLGPARRRLLAQLLDEKSPAFSPAERFHDLLHAEVPPAPARETLDGVLAGRYRIVRELGHGGMATVYLAEDLTVRRQVALKALDRSRARGVTAQRFRLETELLARLSHPNILPLLDAGSADDVPFFVMPYVPGGSLRERIVREGALPVDDACRLAAEVADALAHAHARGVVHRDIKPENVLLDGRRALVADFGVARAIERATGAVRLTAIGVLIGTLSYMSPEQAAGDPVDERSDIYALGCVLHEMLGGEYPGSDDPLESLEERKRGDLPTSSLPAAVPRRVVRIVHRALAAQPARRYQSAREMAQALRRAVAPGTWERIRSRLGGR